MTWDLTIEQKGNFFELMHDMGAHSVFYPMDITMRLSDCGMPVKDDRNKECLMIDSVMVHLVDS
jgi:hypothetical protein